MNTETITLPDFGPCARLANPDAELLVSVNFGPRIVRYGFVDGPNAFAAVPHLSQPLPDGGAWKPYGGHRLWIAPEVFPYSYHPDNEPVGNVTQNGLTLSVSNPPESTTGIAKQMDITLAENGPAVRVVHTLTNHNADAVTASVWALSIVAGGGRVVLPQEPYASHDDVLVPARPLVLWPFTQMADPRWRWGTKYITLRQDDYAPGAAQKVGVYNKAGWGAHVTDAQAFVVLAGVGAHDFAAFPDGGSSFEAYTDGPFQELETLGPLTTIAPGQSVAHTEDWFLAPLKAIEDTDDAYDAHLLPIVTQARQVAEAM